jgi:alpha-L-fucosidase
MSFAAAPASLDPYDNETKAERDARMAWFREAKFGMFIHWGVYAVPAGTYKGKQISGIGEWIMSRGKIPMAEYQEYAREFNPVKYDPDAWVRLAKEAGMKYIVITSKHHDGFALFDSKVSEWDIVDATPYGKDLIAPLAKACKKHGIRLGLYYSQAQDWNQGGSAMRGKWDPAQEHDMDDYIRDIAVPQVREILSNYGPIAVLWWDTPTGMNQERADQLLPLLKLQPGIIHNNRLFNKSTGGDIKTPEQHIPATGLDGDWESCMTMNRTWGFKSYDHDWKSTKTLIQNLVDIASKGGNYLLNVGPTAEGLIPQPSVERLKAIGAWMKVNGESIYGVQASPCRRPAFGRITRKDTDGNSTLYLHVFNWPANGKLFVPVDNKVKACRLLAEPGRTFKANADESGLTVQLTGDAPDPIDSVVELRLAGPVSVTAASKVRQKKDGNVILAAQEAAIHNHGYGDHAKFEDKHQAIGYWTDARTTVDWTFMVHTPGAFAVTAETASLEKSAFVVSVGGKSHNVKVAPSGSYGKFQPLEIGTFTLKKSGEHTLTVKPVRKGWRPVNLKSVTFTPVDGE